jgi:predicted nuclease of predicted toxin-antitoxin system
MKIKFHLDEQMPLGAVRALRSRGIDVTTTPEALQVGASDLEQIEFAHSQGRVLVTCDADFLTVVAAGVQHSGIVLWTKGTPEVGELYRWLSLIHDVLEARDLNSRIEFVP